MSAAIENPSPHGADAATPGRECARILLVDAERDALDVLALALGGAGHEVVRATAAVEAARELEHGRLDLVITATEPDGPGPAVLRIARERWPALPVIATSRDASVAAAVSAMKLGACDFVPHPVDQAQLAQAVRRIVEQNALLRAGRAARRPGEGRPDAELIVGRTHQMQKVFELVEAVADSKATVLIRGETGTGKSLVARAIHQRSQRRHRPFVEISCGAIPETLLESELFGHVKGAFTGAMADKEGKFRAAEGGTVFLDEVSCASASLQVKLLRVLQERKFEPLGSNKTLTADVRVVLATNLDLHKEVEARRFREDLYYRINVVNLELPPLRERLTDIPLLAEHFLVKYVAQRPGRTAVRLRFSEAALECMQRHRWPGNVRELENCVERAVVLSRGEVIDKGDLPPSIVRAAETDAALFSAASGRPLTLREALEDPERRIIRAALEANEWNRQKTAAVLDVNRTTLYKKMKYYGLQPPARGGDSAARS